MSRSHTSAGGGHLSTSDVLALIFGLPVLIGMGVFSPAVLGQQAADWLIEHRVLVPSVDAVVPLLGGTGLGWPHLSVVAGLLVLLVSVLGWRHPRHTGTNTTSAPGAAA